MLVDGVTKKKLEEEFIKIDGQSKKNSKFEFMSFQIVGMAPIHNKWFQGI